MTVINAITPSGRHIKAAMNTAAINTPTAVATGRLRFARLRSRTWAADRTSCGLSAAAAAGLHRWSPGHAGRIGADRDPRRLAGRHRVEVGRDHVVLSGTANAGPGVGARFGRRIVLPHRRLGGERRPDVELVVGRRRRDDDVARRGRDGAARRSAVRSNAEATPCRWHRTSDRHRQLPGREWARARRRVARPPRRHDPAARCRPSSAVLSQSSPRSCTNSVGAGCPALRPRGARAPCGPTRHRCDRRARE